MLNFVFIPFVMLLVIYLIFFQGPNFVRVIPGGNNLLFKSQAPGGLDWGILCGKGKKHKSSFINRGVVCGKGKNINILF